jgi:hypothetical protein
LLCKRKALVLDLKGQMDIPSSVWFWDQTHIGTRMFMTKQTELLGLYEALHAEYGGFPGFVCMYLPLGTHEQVDVYWALVLLVGLTFASSEKVLSDSVGWCFDLYFTEEEIKAQGG